MRHSAICAVLLCLLSFALAEPARTLTTGGPELHVKEVRSDNETIRVTLSCNNESVTDQRIILLAPTVNGEETAFDDGWGTSEIYLKQGERLTVEIAILPVEAHNAPESASFRYVAQGVISEPVSMSRVRGEWQIDPPGDVPDTGRCLVEAGTAPANFSFQAVALSDRISPDEAAVLDSGWATVCLRGTDEENASCMPFCRIPVCVDESGAATATFSGMAVICAGAPSFPLNVEEPGDDNRRMWTVSNITLSGETVYFADLSFEMHCDNPTAVDIAGLTVDSPELGGVCTNCPFGLFSEAAVYLPAYTFNDDKGWTEAIEGAGEESVFSLDQPLTFDLCSAFDLGEVCVYYEYWFTDGSMTIHAPADLQARSPHIYGTGA